MQQPGRIEPLDGLRFVAFLLVLTNHSILAPPPLEAFNVLQPRGWGGVDLFFAISSFILFFGLEKMRLEGRLNLGVFFMRRINRIYPLMIAYAVFALFYTGATDPNQWYRVVGFALGLDNVLSVTGLATAPILFTQHLWSLSFELQLYLLIPALFFAHRALTKRAFLWLLAGIAFYALVARIMAYGLGATHPTIYLLPIFRPESFLVGMALWAAKPRWDWRYSAATALVAWGLFIYMPQPWETWTTNVIAYPMLAIACGATIDAGLRGPVFGRFLSSRPMKFLGERGYGLYVFHLFGNQWGRELLLWLGADFGSVWGWLQAFVVGLVITTVMADLSYRFFEPHFRRDWIELFRSRSSAAKQRAADVE